MVAASASTDLTTFWLEGATTVTAIGTGGAGLGNPETDFFLQGANCISKAAWVNATKGFIIDALGTTFTVPTDGCVIGFVKYDAAGSLDTKANGGLQVIIGSASTAYYHYYVGGNDTIIYDSWFPFTIDPNTATADNTTGSPSGSEQFVGMLGTLPTTSGPTKGNPIAMDAVRYGRGRVDYIDGQAGAYGTFDVAETTGNVNSTRWGLIEKIRGAYFIQGFHSLGTASTAVDFRDSNKTIFIRDSGASNYNSGSPNAVSTGFNRIEVINASSNVDWDNIQITALGTRAPGVFVHTAGTFDANNCQFTGMGAFTLIAASVINDSIFRGCGNISAPGSDLRRTQILVPTTAADGSVVDWNTTTNTDGKLDGVTFSKGTNAHHAISFSQYAASYTIRDITFSGFTNTIGDNAAPLYFPDTGADRAWSITANGCTGLTTSGYKKVRAGDTVSITLDQVTLTLEVRNTAGALITDSTDIALVRDSDDSVLQDSTNVTTGSTTYVYTYSSDVPCYAVVVSAGDYVPFTAENVVLTNADQTVTITLVDDRVYDNP